MYLQILKFKLIESKSTHSKILFFIYIYLIKIKATLNLIGFPFAQISVHFLILIFMFSVILHATTTTAINLQFVFATLVFNWCGVTTTLIFIVLNLMNFVSNHILALSVKFA